MVATVVGFLTLWLKLKYGVEKKVDDNTILTKAGIASADVAAEKAEVAANEASVVAGKMNGGIDAAVAAAIEPLRNEVRAHAAKDEENMREVRAALAEFASNTKLEEFAEYVRGRNHDILNTLNAQVLATNAQTLVVTQLMERVEGRLPAAEKT